MPNPDTILHNGTIYPRADARASSRAIAIWNGLVSDVGSDYDILKLRGRSVRTVDLHGRVVIPGLSDSHIHLLGFGTLLQTLDLSNTQSISEIQKVVSSVSKSKLGKKWIVGRGWDQEKLMEHRYPNANDFSDVREPVFLRRVCGHVGVANAAALSSAGITRTTSDPQGGMIERDPSTGEPTGVLKEGAQELVLNSIPQEEGQVESALYAASRKLLRMGLTSLQCIVENVLELKTLRRMKHEGKIRQSIYAIIPPRLLDKAVEAGMSTETGPAKFRIGGVKLYLDGSLGARTAALSEPYDDSPSNGMLTLEQEALEGIAAKAVASNFQLCIHAIGDRAVGNALTAIETVKSIGKGTRLRHRIEHSSLTPPRLISRMRRNKVVASVQPNFISSDTWAEQRLGARRMRSLYPFRSMLRAGIPLAGGSDCPADNPNPFRGIWSAVARPGLLSDERLTVGDALNCYTLGAAYASFSEGYLGTLEPGKSADMLILDRDPFKCEIDQLSRTRVLETIIEGKSTFHANLH